MNLTVTQPSSGFPLSPQSPKVKKAKGDAAIKAAGLIVRTPDNKVLFLKRSKSQDHSGEWCFPGGVIEQGETPEAAAIRETQEETGWSPETGSLKQVDKATSEDGVEFVTHLADVGKAFKPVLDHEHTGFTWASLNAPPKPLHPGCAMTLKKLGMDAANTATKSLLRQTIKYPPEKTKGGSREIDTSFKNGGLKSKTLKKAPAAEEFERSGGLTEKDRKQKAAMDSIAFDKKSVRAMDKDGRMRVTMTNISKAAVNPYLGSEIPGYQELGLDADKVYNLLRHPDELKKAADTFNGIQLLMRHVPVSAEDHQPWDVVGSTGTEASFDGQFLKNSLSVWSKAAIDAIESEEQKELSSAYHYTPDMTPGVYEGEKYDGVMRDITGNHVALVKEGRAGPDVVVGDSKEKIMAKKKIGVLTRQAAFTIGMLAPLVKSKLAMDTKINLFPVFKDITGSNFDEKKATILEFVTKKTKGKLAQDATIGEVAELLDMIESHGVSGDEPVSEEMAKAMEEAAMLDKGKDTVKAALPEKEGEELEAKDDTTAEVGSFLKDKLSDEDLAAVCAMMRGENGEAEAEVDEEEGEDEANKSGEEKLKELGAADEDDEEDDKDMMADKKKTAKDAESERLNYTSAGRKSRDRMNDEEKADFDKRDAKAAEKKAAAKDKKGAMDDPPPFKGMPKTGGGMVTKDEMNAAVKAAGEGVAKQIRLEQKEIRDAEKFVRPWIGNVEMSFDSAEAVHRKTLELLGVDVKGVHPSAFKTIIALHPTPGSRPKSARSERVAMDAKAEDGFFTRHPDVARIKVM